MVKFGGHPKNFSLNCKFLKISPHVAAFSTKRIEGIKSSILNKINFNRNF